MGPSRAKSTKPDQVAGLTFLLSQVGAHSSIRFAERLEPLGFKPVHVGILRVIAAHDGLSQQALGESLGVFPSRLVLVIDELEGHGLVERRNSPADRRSYALCLTRLGKQTLEQLQRVSSEHQKSVVASLTVAEQAQLAGLLKKIADEQGLKPGVHPGIRKLGGDAK